MRPPGVAQLGGGLAPEATGVAVLVLHNLAVHRLLPSPADAVLNLVATAGLTAFARRAGCSHDDLGIRAGDAAAGLRLGLAAAAVAAGGVVLGASLPATRPFFHDRRVTAVGHGEAIYHLAVRIRSSPPLPRNSHSARPARPGPAATVTGRRRGMDLAALRRLAHALPTLKHNDGNPASGLVADPRRGRRIAVLATMLSTSGAGLLFAWLRLRSRSLLAPILAHAATNASAYLAGQWVVLHTSRGHGEHRG